MRVPHMNLHFLDCVTENKWPSEKLNISFYTFLLKELVKLEIGAFNIN